MIKSYLAIEENEQQWTFPLWAPVTFIGRASSNDVPLGDRSISRYHALVYMVNNRAIIEDLGSLNGTFVNGRRIKRAPLANGDAVKIGNKMLRFHQRELLQE